MVPVFGSISLSIAASRPVAIRAYRPVPQLDHGSRPATEKRSYARQIFLGNGEHNGDRVEARDDHQRVSRVGGTFLRATLRKPASPEIGALIWVKVSSRRVSETAASSD